MEPTQKTNPFFLNGSWALGRPIELQLILNTLLNISLITLTLFSFSIIATSARASEASTISSIKRQDLRLYRVNKDGISDRFWFTRGKARKPGCHNIRKKSRLHRAVSFGYPVCRIYKKKNCAVESIVSFTRDDDDTPTTDISEGFSWYTISNHEKGEKIKSWYCGAKTP